LVRKSRGAACVSNRDGDGFPAHCRPRNSPLIHRRGVGDKERSVGARGLMR
jgi:hypothetical protein